MTSILFLFSCLLALGNIFVIQKIINLKSGEKKNEEVTLSWKDFNESGEEDNSSSEEDVSPSTEVQEQQEENNEENIEEPEENTDEVSNELPKEINLAVPFTSQAPEGNWDQPWQDACEEAAALMMDAYYKDYGLSPIFARDEIQRLVNWEALEEWGGSIEAVKVEKLVNEFFEVEGKKYKVLENPSAYELRKILASGHPILALADGKKLENPNFTNGGPVYHALVIRGYNAEGFITNDPGTRNGENFFYTYQNLMESLGDWDEGKVDLDRAVVLILE